MINKIKELYKLIKNFNNLINMDYDDYKNKCIDLDKLLFNANCRTYKLNHLVHDLKES